MGAHVIYVHYAKPFLSIVTSCMDARCDGVVTSAEIEHGQVKGLVNQTGFMRTGLANNPQEKQRWLGDKSN